MTLKIQWAVSTVFAVGLAGCASMDYSQAEPAVLVNADGKVLNDIETLISGLLDNRRVLLASNVLKTDNRLIIEQNSNMMDPQGNMADGRMRAKPDHFRLLTLDGKCVLLHEQTGEYYPMDSVRCRPL